MVARILSGLVGAVMLISAINWIIDPAAAAAGLEIKESLKAVGGETLLLSLIHISEPTRPY